MRKTLAVTGAVALLVSGLASTASARTIIEPGPGRLDAEVEAVLASLPPGDMTTVVVTLGERTDLAAVRGATPAARLKGTITALQAKANTSQAPIRALLRAQTAQGNVAGLTPLWISNAITVTATAQVIRDLAARADVTSITPNDIRLVPTIGTPEPNLTAIAAPALWDLGYSGQGVVVASLDTGVDVSHPDLAGRWRGGANSWYDPYGQHPGTPTDLSGHGTATTGVMVGGDAGGTSIGMAPGATWIAAKIFNDAGGATATAIHQAFQWALDPDRDPNTPDAPQVVNGSWSIGAGPGCDLSFQPDLQALRSAGILPVFAAGNYGPGGSTSVSPANYPEALAVGAVNNTDLISSASSRGPSTCGGRSGVFPDLVAPGVNVLTTDRYGLYQTTTGTSVSAPHAAGALALLLGAIPGLSGDRAQAALAGSAFDLGTSGPDTTYGYGRLDVLAAYQLLQTQQGGGDLVGPATMSPTLTSSPTNGSADAALHATGDDTATGGSNIAAAEYFTDALGADGSGTSMTVNTAAPIAGLDAVIPAATVSALAEGLHTISVHAKDVAGNWGSTATTTLVIDKTRPLVSGVSAAPNPTLGATSVTLSATATDAASDINRAEWFTGADPGVGNGSPMMVTGPTPWHLSASIDVSSWAEGAYTLNVRARDAAGNWSLTASTVLTVSTPLYFSTLGSTTVPGVAGTADDADIYGWSGTAYSRVIDASGAGSLLGLPGGANVDGFDRVDATRFYVSFAGNVTIPLPGPDLTVQDEDVVYYDAGTWSVYFDGTAQGLTSANQDMDAISIVGGVGGTLYFSTVGNTNPPGIGGTADDADIYSWDGTAFARVVDASGAGSLLGLPAAANVDGFVRVDATRFYLSFSADTTVPVLGAVQDEDVVYNSNGVWSVYFNGTAHGLAAANLDLDAFDVPW